MASTIRFAGFNLNKLSIEKKERKEDIKLDTNIDISNINETKVNGIGVTDSFISVDFVYSINYNPDFAKLEFKGNLLFSMDSDTAKNILKEWENKKISEDFKLLLFNIILKKSNIKALQLEDEFNLPLHIPLPSLKKTSDKKE